MWSMKEDLVRRDPQRPPQALQSVGIWLMALRPHVAVSCLSSTKYAYTIHLRTHSQNGSLVRHLGSFPTGFEADLARRRTGLHVEVN